MVLVGDGSIWLSFRLWRCPGLLTFTFTDVPLWLNGCDTCGGGWGGAAYRQDGLKRKWEGLMTETTQEFVQLFYRDGSIIQPLQDK